MTSEGSQEKKERCPACNNVLFNRIYNHCMTCGAKLPPELCLSDEEKEAINRRHRNEDESLDRLRDDRDNLPHIAAGP